MSLEKCEAFFVCFIREEVTSSPRVEVEIKKWKSKIIILF